MNRTNGKNLLLAKIEPVQKLLQPLVLIDIPTTGFECKGDTDAVFVLDHLVHLTKKCISSLYNRAVWALAVSTMDDGYGSLELRHTLCYQKFCQLGGHASAESVCAVVAGQEANKV